MTTPFYDDITIQRLWGTIAAWRVARALAVENADEALQGKVDDVIKGVLGGKLPAKKVDELHDATGKAQRDRAAGRAIGASRQQIGLVTHAGQ